MDLRSFFHKIIYLGRGIIPRCDFDKCRRFNEYNEAFRFANKYIDIGGMKEQRLKIVKAGEKYEKDIEAIVKPKREAEESKYKLWEKWYMAKNICMWITIGLFLLAIFTALLMAIISPPPILYDILLLLSACVIIALPAFLVAKAGECICAGAYNRYVSKIQTEIYARNKFFSEEARSIYEAMDTLYLRSLDPAHREMVLMHREQTEHNKEIMRMEKVRQMKEDERLQEERRTRRAQERLLAIEEERERERKGYRR